MAIETMRFTSNKATIFIASFDSSHGLNWRLSNEPGNPFYSLIDKSNESRRIFSFPIDENPYSKADMSLHIAGDAPWGIIDILIGNTSRYRIGAMGSPSFSPSENIAEESFISRSDGNIACEVAFQQNKGVTTVRVRNDSQHWVGQDRRWFGVDIIYKRTGDVLTIAMINLNPLAYFTEDEIRRNLAQLGLPIDISLDEAITIAKQHIDITKNSVLLPTKH